MLNYHKFCLDFILDLPVLSRLKGAYIELGFYVHFLTKKRKLLRFLVMLVLALSGVMARKAMVT